MFRFDIKALRSLRMSLGTLTSLGSTCCEAFLAPRVRAASMTPSLYSWTTRFSARALVTCFLVLACSVALIAKLNVTYIIPSHFLGWGGVGGGWVGLGGGGEGWGVENSLRCRLGTNMVISAVKDLK